MEGVFEGFTSITVLVLLGMLVAHVGLIDASGQRALATIAFFVAGPALLLVVLADSELSEVLSGNMIAIAAAMLASAVPVIIFTAWKGLRLGDSVIYMLCSAYQNGGNLGIPIAAYVLGDAALVAPVMLIQLLVLQPIALALLDADALGHMSARTILVRTTTNPFTIGTGIGVFLSATSTSLPRVAMDPLELIAGMAVPAMLMAYGISLRLGPLPGRGAPVGDLALVTGLKMIVQPAAAYLIGRFTLGLEDTALLAVTILSALPTAQNIFIMATRYNRSMILARDAIFISTISSVPVIAIITALIAP